MGILPFRGGADRRRGNITDHLGNVRLTFSVDNNNAAEVIQEDSYYPFGMTMNGLNFLDIPDEDDKNKYLYNGKELQEDFGLDWYDYGARMYDAQLGRWHVVDPMAEDAYSWNPYHYVKNNPILLIDPDGMKDTTYNAETDKAVQDQPGTETPLILGYVGGIPIYNQDAYNCHSYTWSNSQGDPTDDDNADWVSEGVTKWDQNPDNNTEDYFKLDNNQDNVIGDKIIYYVDENENGTFDDGDMPVHSANVTNTNSEGYTTEVTSKRGQLGVSTNHPNASGFYQTHNGQSDGKPTSKQYYRKKPSGNNKFKWNVSNVNTNSNNTFKWTIN